jgi:hypothetical protein
MWLISAFSSAIFLLSLVLSIPIAFDVGGRDAGLGYSLALFLFYAFYSTSKLLTPEHSRVRWFFKNLIGWSQWFVLPALLIWALGRFSVDAGEGWVSRTVSQVTMRNKPSSVWDWLFGHDGVVETIALGGWDSVLSYSSPVFQLLEGFCSLLVIQAAGQITRWLVNRGIVKKYLGSANGFADYPPRFLELYHLERRLLPVACCQLPSNRQRRCHLDRRDDDLGCFPLCYRHRQWTWKSGRVLAALCLHRSLRLPNLYRLSTVT